MPVQRSDLVLRFSNEMAKILDQRRPGRKVCVSVLPEHVGAAETEKPDGRLLLEMGADIAIIRALDR